MEETGLSLYHTFRNRTLSVLPICRHEKGVHFVLGYTKMLVRCWTQYPMNVHFKYKIVL